MAKNVPVIDLLTSSPIQDKPRSAISIGPMSEGAINVSANPAIRRPANKTGADSNELMFAVCLFIFGAVILVIGEQDQVLFITSPKNNTMHIWLAQWIYG